MVRNTARALIIQDGKLLTIKKERPHIGIYYTLPGGAQEPDETLDQTLQRECREEVGLELLSSKLIGLREYISNNHEYSFIMKEVHAIDFIYECTAYPAVSPLSSPQADVGQIGIEWLPIEKIKLTITQSDALLRPYKFPLITHDFFKEYFLHPSIEAYKSIIFASGR